MKINKLLLGVAFAGVLYSVAYFSKGFVAETAQYVARESVESTFQGGAEYIHAMRANQVTGKVAPEDVYAATNSIKKLQQVSQKAAIGMNWNNYGPDNVGGRTRAFLIDKDNSQLLYAGSTTGGMFFSTNGGDSWSPIVDHNLGDNLTVSCITQASNGRIFFGTGNSFESVGNGSGASGAIGGGVFEIERGTNTILPVIQTSTTPNNNTSDQWATINGIACRGDRLYLGTATGLKFASPDGSGKYPTLASSWVNPVKVVPNGPTYNATVNDLKIAEDGTVFVAYGNRLFVSTTGDDNSFNGTSISGSARMVIDIAPSNSNILYAASVNSSNGGCLNNIYISEDKGVNWSVIGPGGSTNFDPFGRASGLGCQGGYDAAIGVNPEDPYDIVVGGIRLVRWKRTLTNPVAGNWEYISHMSSQLGYPKYVHADIHAVKWGKGGRLFILGDGGVFRSLDNGETFTENNNGYNVTQFYSVATSAKGLIMGGTQDNGTQIFSHGTAPGSSTWASALEINGGDGFACDFSNLGTTWSFSTVYQGSLTRNNLETFTRENLISDQDLGGATCGEGCGWFYTEIRNWESDEDYNSPDSITFVTTKAYNINDTIHYVSETNDMPLYSIATAPIAAGTTITLQDYVQAKLAFGNVVGAVYITKDASKTGLIAQWDKIAGAESLPDVFGGTVSVMEYSGDGDHLFVGTMQGNVYRLDNLSGIKDSLNTDIRSGSSIVTCNKIGSFSGRVVTGLAIDPNNADHVIATLGNFGNSDYVYRSKDATQAGASFESIQGIPSPSVAGYLPKMPVFDAEIDFNNEDIVLIGTEYGVWSSDNAFSGSASAVRWSSENTNGMAYVPVFQIRQQTLPYNKCWNSQMYYLGTHGRGFYASNTLVGFEEIAQEKKNTKLAIRLYPNPTSEQVAIDILDKRESVDVSVYDMRGKLVFQENNFKGNQKMIDVSSWTKGTYFVSILSEKSRGTSKFIVN